MFLTHSIYFSFAASIFLCIGGHAAPSNVGKCILPNHPPNGKWEIIGESESKPGSRVPFATILTFSCDELYRLSEDHSVITCLGEEWSAPPLECIRIEKTNKVKRRIKLSRNSNEDSADDSDERGGDGIVIKSGGKKIVIGSGEIKSSGLRGRGGSEDLDEDSDDEIVFKPGRKRIVIGRGEEGSSEHGGRGGSGEIVVGSDEDYRRTKHTKHAIYRDEDGDIVGVGKPGRNGGRGEDGIVINGGRVYRDITGKGGRGGHKGKGGRGGNGVAIGGGTISGQNIVGTGGNGGKRKRREVQEENQSISQDGSRGQDGLVIEKGEPIPGYAKGVGQPGGIGGRGGDGIAVNTGRIKRDTEQENDEAILTRQKRGGRGGDGVVLSGGEISGGTIKGKGGRGGKYKKREVQEENQPIFQENFEEREEGLLTRQKRGGRGGDGFVMSGGTVSGGTVTGTGGRGGSQGKKRKNREVQEENQPILQENVEESEEAILTRQKRGGRGGDGVVMSGGTVSGGSITGTGGRGGSRGKKRKNREVQEENHSILQDDDDDEKIEETILTRQKRGGRGGDGFVMSGGTVSGGTITGTGGRGGSRGKKRKNRQVQEENQLILQDRIREGKRQKRGLTGTKSRQEKCAEKGWICEISTDDIRGRRQKREYKTQGGRGGDGIVDKSGGQKTVIGPGEEGSSVYDQNGVARGGQGGYGVIEINQEAKRQKRDRRRKGSEEEGPIVIIGKPKPGDWL